GKPVGPLRAFLIPLCWALWFLAPLAAQEAPRPETPKLEPLKTTITVAEKISAETPANVSVIDRRELDQTPGANLDDRLREIPGFSLFRRTSSLIAHPTT